MINLMKNIQIEKTHIKPQNLNGKTRVILIFRRETLTFDALNYGIKPILAKGCRQRFSKSISHMNFPDPIG